MILLETNVFANILTIILSLGFFIIAFLPIILVIFFFLVLIFIVFYGLINYNSTIVDRLIDDVSWGRNSESGGFILGFTEITESEIKIKGFFLRPAKTIKRSDLVGAINFKEITGKVISEVYFRENRLLKMFRIINHGNLLQRLPPTKVLNVPTLLSAFSIGVNQFSQNLGNPKKIFDTYFPERVENPSDNFTEGSVLGAILLDTRFLENGELGSIKQVDKNIQIEKLPLIIYPITGLFRFKFFEDGIGVETIMGLKFFVKKEKILEVQVKTYPFLMQTIIAHFIHTEKNAPERISIAFQNKEQLFEELRKRNYKIIELKYP